MPKFLFANARSAVNKLDMISAVAVEQSIKCLALAETWFNDSHSEDITHFPNYACFRDDRSNRIGGGVAIWAHLSLHSRDFCLEAVSRPTRKFTRARKNIQRNQQLCLS